MKKLNIEYSALNIEYSFFPFIRTPARRFGHPASSRASYKGLVG